MESPTPRTSLLNSEQSRQHVSPFLGCPFRGKEAPVHGKHSLRASGPTSAISGRFLSLRLLCFFCFGRRFSRNHQQGLVVARAGGDFAGVQANGRAAVRFHLHPSDDARARTASLDARHRGGPQGGAGVRDFPAFFFLFWARTVLGWSRAIGYSSICFPPLYFWLRKFVCHVHAERAFSLDVPEKTCLVSQALHFRLRTARESG